MPKLLIVDDEKDVREFARNFFRKRGVNVFVAGNGEEALPLVAGERPDLVLLDIRMPGMNGMDVLRKLRGQNDQTSVIMVSGIEDDGVKKDAMSLNVLGFVHKPLVLEELEKVVLSVLKINP